MSTYASEARGTARRRSFPYAAAVPAAPEPARPMPLHRVAFDAAGATPDQAAALAAVSAFLADPDRSQFVHAGRRARARRQRRGASTTPWPRPASA